MAASDEEQGFYEQENYMYDDEFAERGARSFKDYYHGT